MIESILVQELKVYNYPLQSTFSNTIANSVPYAKCTAEKSRYFTATDQSACYYTFSPLAVKYRADW